jgi:hypothetical protein
MLSRAKAAAAAGDCQALFDFIGIFPSDSTAADARSAAAQCRAGYLDRLVATDMSPVTDADINRIAAEFSIEPAALRAIIRVESGRASFSANGRPIILFEPHIFSRMTEHRYDATNPDISYRSWGEKPYPRDQDGRWAQLRAAYTLDPEAAVGAASWGRYQILGRNFSPAGYGSATEFVAALSKSEVYQLRLMAMFLQGNGLIDEVQRLDWEGFARGYNGPGGAARYAPMLREAYVAGGGDASRLPAAPPPAAPRQNDGVDIPVLGELAPAPLGWLLALAAGALGGVVWLGRRRRA